jgi:hypothetical protein
MFCFRLSAFAPLCLPRSCSAACPMKPERSDRKQVQSQEKNGERTWNGERADVRGERDRLNRKGRGGKHKQRAAAMKRSSDWHHGKRGASNTDNHAGARRLYGCACVRHPPCLPGPERVWPRQLSPPPPPYLCLPLVLPVCAAALPRVPALPCRRRPPWWHSLLRIAHMPRHACLYHACSAPKQACVRPTPHE